MTTAQKIAADPKISAKVAANAGTGKTRVLVNRVLRLLLARVHPSKILCLTFTKAAAAEMADRITTELKKWVRLSDLELGKELEELTGEKYANLGFARQLFTATLQSLPPPRIQTIHSFCQEVLSKFPLEATVPPYFSVIDEPSAAELLKDARHKLLSKQDEPMVLAAITYLSENCSEFKFDELLEEIIANRNKFRDILHHQPLTVEFTLPDVRGLVVALENSPNENDRARADRLKIASKSADISSFASVFLTAKNEPRAISGVITKKAAEHFDVEIISRIQAQLVEVIDKKLEAAEIEFSNHVITAANALFAIYDDLKFYRNALDYDDLIFYTKKLFSTSSAAAWVLYKLDGRIEHILVDEAQDTTPQQWEIISAIVDEFFAGEGAAKRERTVFIVGDEKQSIYSFQGADPAGFASVSRSIGKLAADAEKNWREIPLDTSFRSLPEVLAYVDRVFSKLEIKSQVTTSEKPIKHQAVRQGQGVVEIWPLVKREKAEEQIAWELPLNPKLVHDEVFELAGNIAAKVQGWLADGIISNPADVLILLRRRGRLANLIINRLKSRGIPVAGSDRLALASNIAVQDLISLANFTLLPEDDLSLAEVLKSPLFGISEDQLFEWCYKRESSLKNNIKNETISAKLNELCKLAQELPPFEFFAYVLDACGGKRKFVERLGYGVLDPLEEFLDLALKFEQNKTSSLQGFVDWFGKTAAVIKRDMERPNGEVRVMTVHASKGLQAKVVVLPDTTALPDNRQNQIFWDEQGRVFAFPAYTERSKRARAVKRLKTEADYAEYLRLMYVALTRAEDQIYICGATGDREMAEGC